MKYDKILNDFNNTMLTLIFFIMMSIKNNLCEIAFGLILIRKI